MDTSQESTISTTDVEAFIGDLDGGVFEKVLSAALSQTAAATVDYGKKGKVTLVFDFERVADSSAVIVVSTIKFEKPTLNGTSSEKSTRSTPMYVGKGGKLTLAPERQLAMFDRAGNISQPTTKE